MRQCENPSTLAWSSRIHMVARHNYLSYPTKYKNVRKRLYCVSYRNVCIHCYSDMSTLWIGNCHFNKNSANWSLTTDNFRKYNGTNLYFCFKNVLWICFESMPKETWETSKSKEKKSVPTKKLHKTQICTSLLLSSLVKCCHLANYDWQSLQKLKGYSKFKWCHIFQKVAWISPFLMIFEK